MARPMRESLDGYNRYPLRVEAKKWNLFTRIAKSQGKSIAMLLDGMITDFVEEHKQTIQDQIKEEIQELNQLLEN